MPKGRYSRGSTETFLDQDLATLKLGGGVPELIDRLRLQVGRLDITRDWLPPVHESAGRGVTIGPEAVSSAHDELVPAALVAVTT